MAISSFENDRFWGPKNRRFLASKIADFEIQKAPILPALKNDRFQGPKISDFSTFAEILQNPEIGAKKMPKSALKSV